MESMTVWQVLSALAGVVAFLVTVTVWPLLSYIQRRRDQELDRMHERQELHEVRLSAHGEDLAESKGNFRVFVMMGEELKEIRTDIKEIRKNIAEIRRVG